MVDTWWYWVSIGQHWLVLGGTGSVEGGTRSLQGSKGKKYLGVRLKRSEIFRFLSMVTIEQRINNRLILEQSDLISRKCDLYQTHAI